MNVLGLTIEGLSVGGLETCLELPAYRLAFDLGSMRASTARLSTVLFTHAHIDHLGAVATHAARRGLLHLEPPTYVVPPEIAPGLGELLAAWRRLDRAELACRVLPLGPGETHTLRRDLVVRPFRTVHRVVSQGYTLVSRTRRLRAEYRGLPGAELARLRSQGTRLEDEHETVELAVSGDTRIEGLLAHPDVLRARRLALEVTFLDERVSLEQARWQGHLHLDEVLAHADAFECDALVFTHFSPRYSAADVRAILAARLPDGLRERVHAFV
jgi:ribonuclease Z